jgi:DNA-binding LytR/AlgR family response regulator
MSEGHLRVLLAAEEENTRMELRRILQAEDGVLVIGEAAGPSDTVSRIARLQPDLVFLDMQMEGLDEVDITANLDYLPEIVLTSSLHQHALRAYENSALDFLLKPLSADRVGKAIARARRLLNSQTKSFAGIDALVPPLGWRAKPVVSRLAVHKGKRVLVLSLKDIHYIKAESRLVFAFTEQDRYLINRTIIELEELLRDNGFFQINRATVLNLDYLLEIIPWFSGTCRLRLANGMEFPLSRDRVSGLKAMVGLPQRWSGK